jgi:hypothetical protein
MRIIQFSNSTKKPSKKDLEQQRVNNWVMKQKAIDSKKALKVFAKEIEEIRIKNPEFLNGKTVQL